MANFDSVVQNVVRKFRRQSITESVNNKIPENRKGIFSFYEEAILCHYKDKYVVAERATYTHDNTWYIKIYVANKHKKLIQDTSIYILNSDSQVHTWRNIYMEKYYDKEHKAFRLYRGFVSDMEFLDYLYHNAVDIWFDLYKIPALRSGERVKEVMGEGFDRVCPVIIDLCLEYIQPHLVGLLLDTFKQFKEQLGEGTNS